MVYIVDQTTHAVVAARGFEGDGTVPSSKLPGDKVNEPDAGEVRDWLYEALGH